MSIDYKLNCDILNYEYFLFHFAESKCNISNFNTLISARINQSLVYTIMPKATIFNIWSDKKYKKHAEQLCIDMAICINYYLYEYDISEFFTVTNDISECSVIIACKLDVVQSNFKKFNDLMTFAKIVDSI